MGQAAAEASSKVATESVNKLEDAGGNLKEFLGSIKDFKELGGLLKQVLQSAQNAEKKQEQGSQTAPIPPAPSADQAPPTGPAQELPDFQKPPQPADTTQLPVDEFNRNRGQLYTLSESFGEIIAKLSQPENRESFVKGLLSPAWFFSSDSECERIYKEISNTMPVLSTAILAHSEGPNNGLLHLLNLLVKVDKIMSEMKKEGPLRRCLSFTDKDVHVFLVKLLVFGKEFFENSRSSFEVWASIANAGLMFQMEAFQSAGEEISDALKAVIATEVSIPDSELLKIKLIPCLMTILKTRNELPVEDGEFLFGKWTRAADASRLKCLTFVA